MSQGLNRPHKEDHTVRYPEPDNSNPLRAPRTPNVALPVQEEEQDGGFLDVIFPELVTIEQLSRKYGVFDYL